MKTILLFISICLIVSELYSQNVAITDDDAYTANSSAMLDVKSTTKGFLVPRLTTAQRTTVSSPATGLLVFDTNEGSFYFYNGTSWINLTSGISSGIIGYTSPDKVYLTDINDKFGIGTVSPSGKMEVKSDVSIGLETPIFNVVNSTGDTVFAVYEQGVRINVYDDPLAKATASKGGFAVGGFSPSKAGLTNEYLRVTPDSVRVYINDDYVAAKTTASKGGFAVGGFSPSKAASSTNNYLFVQDDSTRIYTGDTISGFGVENLGIGSSTSYMHLTPLNYSIGHQAGNSITTGTYNSFIGYQAGFHNNIGNKNYFIGYRSGYNNLDGYSNIFIGDSAGFSNTSGMKNVFIGNQSGMNNLIGKYNVSLGYNAGFTNNADYNVFLGYQAGYSNTTGWGNTAIGYLSLYSNTIGRNNVANGYEALYSNTLGDFNVANGYQSLYFNSMGAFNVAHGYQALYKNTFGNYNVANGYMALYSNTTGQDNTAEGYQAMYFNTTAQQNVAIGKSALFNANTNYNVAVGNSALYSNTTGSYNTALGFSAFFSGTAYVNSTALGYGTAITASTQARIGNSGITSIGGYAGWTTLPSDRRFKKNIVENVPGLAFITKLRPVTYNIDMEAIADFLHTPDSLRMKVLDELKANMLQTGFIAQEVESAANEVGFDFCGVDKPKNSGDFYGLRYAEFTVPLVKSVQELNAEVESQKEIINQLLERIEKLENK